MTLTTFVKIIQIGGGYPILHNYQKELYYLKETIKYVHMYQLNFYEKTKKNE